MNANTKNPNNTIVLTVEKYQEILETNMEQSIRISKLEKTLQAEYDYAEGVMKERDQLKNELESMTCERDMLKEYLPKAEVTEE